VVNGNTNRKGVFNVLTKFQMSRRVYSEINLHITWHTKHSLPMIRESMEAGLHGFLRNRVFETPDAIFHAIGGVANHIHLVVSIRPTVDIDDWIGKLKGASSHTSARLCNGNPVTG